MASSNRHWPSMFKSKPCNSHHQWQQDINSSLISNGCQRTPYSSGCEERSPEPKPRWNPRPEQIRILEAIFNSGMVNPPRDEIRKIRAQLQEFGQVGDANVFYWFQNRKSRSKHKQQRNLHNIKNPHHPALTPPPPPITSNIMSPSTLTLPSSSSSSSSEKSSSNNSAEMFFPSLCPKNVLDASTSPTGSVNQPFLYTQNEVLAVPFSLPFSEGFCFQDAPNVSHVVDNSMENCSSFVLGDFLLMGHDESSKKQQQMSFTATTTAAPCTTTAQATICPMSTAALSTVNHYQGAGNVCETEEMGPTKSTVFINDVAFEVTMAPFNVRDSFGDDAVLVDSNGQPVLTNEWGVTLQPLQHGAFYYLIRMLSSSTHHTTVDLV